MRRRTLLWTLAAIAGIVLVAGLTVAASSLSSLSVALSSEPLQAGQALAPPAEATPTPTATPRRRVTRRPRATPTLAPTVAPAPSVDDSGGGGHGADDGGGGHGGHGSDD